MDLFRTSDGRLLEYVDGGDPRGRPVVFLPGTPGTAGTGALIEAAARRHQVRLLSVSRPGYGGSTTTPPGLLAVARDVGALADDLALDEFAVLGMSGGGPFALATAAALPGRVRAVLVGAGLGPVHLLAPERLEPEDVRALDLLAAGDVDNAVALVTAGARAIFEHLRQLPAEDFGTAMDEMAPPGEHYFDSRPEERTVFRDDFRRALERYDGFVRDNLSWLGTWDFDLADVVAPVVLRYGGADMMVPAGNGEWLARQLPTATLTVRSDAGHGDSTFGAADELFAALDPPT